MGFAGERRVEGDDAVEESAEREDIGAKIDLVEQAGRLLGSRVGGARRAVGAPPARGRRQGAVLRGHGLADLVAEGRQRWAVGGIRGGLAGLGGRCRAVEAQALTDPGGLGAFRVLEWVRRPGPSTP